ncbi:hypothetical protein KC332_g15803 [Hortaea werneckii]|nr:hypothetical protein KC358_g16462 [Hortaea werneckii]KAI6799684.1 hypothetical protein KC350_g16029 [Hortaea werneckii]KAI6903072.1 hypothetical protein KC348_g15826 [Hortaea werneckii]KAI6921897.1 hypothetical protein KC341_g15694 [Hortaea werneckii]KAI6962333.1 hypothetical protein KC329_g16378 [Hortaea werneckii]
MPHLLHTLHTSHHYSSSSSAAETTAQTTATLVPRSSNNTGASTAILFICLAVIGVLIALGIWIGAKKAQLRSRKQRPYDAGWYRSPRDGSTGISRTQKGRASMEGASSDDVEEGLNGPAEGYGSQVTDGFEMQTPAPSYHSRSQRSGRDGRGIRAPGPRYGYAMPASFQGSVRSGPSDYSRRGAASDGRHFDVVPI